MVSFSSALRLLLLLAAVCVESAVAEQSEISTKAAAATISRLDRDVPQILEQLRIPSASIAFVQNGQLAGAAAYGKQDTETAATTETLYNVASLTKPISAEVILRLASAGKLSLDEPMHRYWIDPDIADDDRRKELTVRLALSHQTGFPNWRYQTGGLLQFQRPPGQEFGYSGEGYEYAARYAEKRLAKPFEQLASSVLFEPARMADTSYTGKSWFKGRIAKPADRDGQFLEPKIGDVYCAADDLYSTASDFARFLASTINGDHVTAEIAADRERIHVIRTLDSEMANRPGATASGMGLGWEVFRFADQTYLLHSGSDSGTYTFVYFSPTRRTGAVVLTNSDNGEKALLPILDRLQLDPTLVMFMHSVMK